MRKLITYLLFGLLIVTISSCAKEEIVDSNKNDKSISGKIGLTPKGQINEPKFDKTNSDTKDQVKMRTIYCEWGWLWKDGRFLYDIIWCDCFSIFEGNCLPTVTISSNIEAYNSFKTHYDNGTMTEYFATDDYKSIFSGLDDLNIVDELQNGEIILHLNHDVEIDKDFYIGLPQDIEFSTSDTSWMSQTECVLVIYDDL